VSPDPTGPRTVPVAVGDGVTLDVPEGWVVQAGTKAGAEGSPLVVRPPAWARPDEAPAIVVAHVEDRLTGARLAADVATAVDGLTDPLVLHLGVTPDDGIDVVVAHRNLGVDVTTIERHHVRPDGGRWVVAFTATARDLGELGDLAPLMHRVVASLSQADDAHRPGTQG
jgi:hypothetical protein